MSVLRIAILAALSMMAFAANSLLCRLALKQTGIDAGTFMTVRLVSGAAMLWTVLRFRRSDKAGHGNWLSALALFVYAAGFSFAYLSLPTGTGALLLFGGVQSTMISYGLATGERLCRWQVLGLLVSFAGLVALLLLPGVSAPSLRGSIEMLVAGGAWGIYSLRGRGQGDPTKVTTGNFLRTVPLTLAVSAICVLLQEKVSVDRPGLIYAIVSGAITSGLGYVVWYATLPALQATTASILHLTVPVLAALGGILFLHESTTPRLALATLAILGGLALFFATKPRGATTSPRTPTDPAPAR